MSVSRSRNLKKDSMDDLYPTGTSYTEVLKGERLIRMEAEAKLDCRIAILEDQMMIVESYDNFPNQYPKLKAAYEKFREEEAKMKTFEALKNSK